MSELSFAKRNLFILLDCRWVNVDNMSYSQCDRYFWGRDFVQRLLVKDLLVIGWRGLLFCHIVLQMSCGVCPHGICVQL